MRRRCAYSPLITAPGPARAAHSARSPGRRDRPPPGPARTAEAVRTKR
ncbi:hypothetical protein MicB006_1641 [Micromonospora sp. B006]|nr:hypothetical protein MicB006_1641 [Micromonospora sp. B006]